MPNALLENLRVESNDLRTQVEQAQTTAAEQQRDLTEAEQANVDALLQRAEALRPRILHLVEQEEGFASTATALSRVTQGGTGEQITRSGDVTPDRAVSLMRSMYPEAGQYVLDVLISSDNSEIRRAGLGPKVAEARARLSRVQEIQRAVANTLVADVPGLIPTPIVGDVINVLDASRPVWASFTQRPMPASGATFTRPMITQHTQIAKQTAEKTEVASRKLTVGGTNLTKDTYGGYIDLSVQVVDWTDPAILSIVIGDLGDEYAIQTEAAVSAVLAAITQTQALPATPTAADIATFIAGAAAKVYAGGKVLPDRLWVSVDMWAKLLGMTASDGRPAFPGIGAVNAAGNIANATAFTGSIMGLPLVVGPALPANTAIVGASKYAEAYEDRKGDVRQFEVNILGWLIGYYGYATAAVLVPSAFAKNV